MYINRDGNKNFGATMARKRDMKHYTDVNLTRGSIPYLATCKYRETISIV